MTAPDRLAAAFRALGHPARLALLETLAARGACVCGQLVDGLPLAQSTVSQHLKVLKAAGLIQGETDGPRVCYGLDPHALAVLRDETAALFDSLLPAPAAPCCP